MDKFFLAEKIKHSGTVNKEAFLQQRCRNKRVLDLGCIRHDADSALKDPNWIHKKIREVASEVVGIDYLPDEIRKLKLSGYDIVFGDVTKPLDLPGKFDVIVAGDLIEHLTNFDGFFDNCKRFLKPGGMLIISTANPFYSGEFHYLAFKRNFLVNPEHTCWIDPQCLTQLSERAGFYIDDIHYIKNSWKLGNVICERKGREYDIHKDKWSNDSRAFKVFRVIFSNVFNFPYISYKFFSGTNSALVKYSDYIAVLKSR